jgi:Na+-driven multidrug efflux pump
MMIGGVSSNFLWFALITELIFAGLCAIAWWRTHRKNID